MVALKGLEGIISTPEDEIIVHLLRYIEEHGLSPGERLPSIREMSQLWEYNVSQIRSAIIKAAALGFVEMRSRSGCYVKEFDFSATAGLFALMFEATFSRNKPILIHLYNLKTAIERSVNESAARVSTDEEVFRLHLILQEMEESVDRLELIRLDEKFHIELARITRNPLFETVIAAIHAMIREERFLGDFYQFNQRRSLEEHREIFDAIRDRDPERAARIAERHTAARKNMLMGLRAVTQ